jgi:hypothetical protein
VSTKLALVLITLTRTVLVLSVRARVKRPLKDIQNVVWAFDAASVGAHHITALKAIFIAKKNYFDQRMHGSSHPVRALTVLTTISTRDWESERLKKRDIALAQVVVSWVVTSFAKTPFSAAHPPEAMANETH